ncbi:MAG TPA: hypothetical protein VE776_05010 [Actinomycetota bacterium]|jgi:hypothetical protein|nr:hypothetical protein [Actinomycetota bacterium]
MSDLLNRTVTDGIRITAVLRADNQVGWIGFGVNRREPFPGRGIPLTLGGTPAQCYIHVMHTLVQRRGELATHESSFGVYLDADLSTCLMHYDFAREPGNRYPAAHVQVNAVSAAFGELCGRLGRRDDLSRLHLPVGGKRFRPCLEDLVEMLIVEGLAAGRAGWESAISEHRAAFLRIQLKAAVRDDPEAAREELTRWDEEQRHQLWPRRRARRRRQRS